MQTRAAVVEAMTHAAESALAEGARPLSVLHALLDSIERVPDQIALISGDRQLTYREVGRAVASLARELEARGARNGRVIVLLPNSIEAVVATLATFAVHAEAVPLNPFLTPGELAPAFEAARAGTLVCNAEGDAKSRRLPGSGRPPITVLREPGQDGPGAPRPDDGELSERHLPAADAPALLLFTGGTTGEPKGVRHRHRSLGASLQQHCAAWPMRFGAERFVSSAPMFHAWGLLYATWVPLYSGGTLVIVPKFDAAVVLETITAQRITVLAGGPASIYIALLAHPLAASTDFSSLSHCLTGGAPCPPEVHRRWQERTGLELLEGWGMSEAAPLCLSRPGSIRLGSVGQPVVGAEVEVVDVEGGSVRLPALEAGEVRVKGPQLMSGYLGASDDPAGALRDGWLYTGDIGFLDPEGYLHLVGRKKHVIIVGGYNVYPRHVEDVLLALPEVSSVACVGVPDERLGEVVAAFVVRRPSAPLTETDCLEYCKQHLVKYRRPVYVAFVSELPLTPARKVDLRRLQEMARERWAPAG